jgi:hypothetical protein
MAESIEGTLRGKLMTQKAIASSKRRRCVFVTVLWGDWHRNAFLDANLPTMLAPGNLPALSADVDCEYIVYTTAHDASQMKQNRTFVRLCSIMSVSFKFISPATTKNIFSLHHQAWRGATKYARQRGAFILLMPPDVAWADGSFARLRDALGAGKRAIFMTYPRVVSETIIPALIERYPKDAQNAMIIPAKDMMGLAITHVHPLMAAYRRGSKHFPVHPEMVLWPVEGDGFLVRMLARELFCFEPKRYPLNAKSLLARTPPDDELHVFSDSSEFLGVSFTPLWKDMEWYLASRRLDPLFVGRWWTDYDSPMNDQLSAVDLRFTCGTAEEAQWRKAGAQADSLLRHLRSAREFVRILMTLNRMGLSRSASFLAAALRTHGLARRWPHRGPFIILAPTDSAFERAGFDRIPGDGMSCFELLKIVRAHVAVLEATHTLKNKIQVASLSGDILDLEDLTAAERCGDNLVMPTERILYGQHGNSFRRKSFDDASDDQVLSGSSVLIQKFESLQIR